MPRLLFIPHAPSPNTVTLRKAASDRISAESQVDLIVKAPLDANADDALQADGCLLYTSDAADE